MRVTWGACRPRPLSSLHVRPRPRPSPQTRQFRAQRGHKGKRASAERLFFHPRHLLGARLDLRALTAARSTCMSRPLRRGPADPSTLSIPHACHTALSDFRSGQAELRAGPVAVFSTQDSSKRAKAFASPSAPAAYPHAHGPRGSLARPLRRTGHDSTYRYQSVHGRRSTALAQDRRWRRPSTEHRGAARAVPYAEGRARARHDACAAVGRGQ